MHHHFVPPEYLAEVLRRREPLPAVMRNWTPERSIDDMDSAGIKRAMLSITTPGFSFADPEAAARLARTCNEYATQLAQRFRGRFGLFAAVPLPDVELTLREMAYAFDVLECEGIGVFTSYGNTWLGDEAYAPVWEKLDLRRAIVFVHPTVAPCCANLIPEVSESIVEYGTDTTRTIASLLFTGTAARYPNIRFVFSHAGGTMPFLIERFENFALRPENAARLPQGLAHELTRFYYDTAQASNPAAMAALTQVVPSAQILFGTDFPYRHAAGYHGSLPACGFTAAEVAAIQRGNAERLLADR